MYFGYLIEEMIWTHMESSLYALQTPYAYALDQTTFRGALQADEVNYMKIKILCNVE